MDLVVDANVLIAALIKEGTSYTLLFEERFHLYTAEYIFTEIEEHKEEILNKTKRTEEEVLKLLKIFEKRIILIPLEELTTFLEKAEEICPDPDDVVYFTLALKLNCPIWSNDKKIRKQHLVKIYNTEELLKML